MNGSVPVSLVVILMLAGCGLLVPKETRYLRSAQGRDSQEQVIQNLGRPRIATIGPDGDAVWVYQIREEDPGNRWTSIGLWCDEYVLTFDDHSILRRWTHKSEFHGGELMPAYCVPDGFTMPDAAKQKTESQ